MRTLLFRVTLLKSPIPQLLGLRRTNRTLISRAFHPTPSGYAIARGILVCQAKNPMHLILYSKIGCHLCEGLQEKLMQITDLDIQLEIREITTNPDWFDRYQYEIPVLYLQVDGIDRPIPRFSPRAGIDHVQQILHQFSSNNG